MHTQAAVTRETTHQKNVYWSICRYFWLRNSMLILKFNILVCGLDQYSLQQPPGTLNFVFNIQIGFVSAKTYTLIHITSYHIFVLVLYTWIRTACSRLQVLQILFSMSEFDLWAQKTYYLICNIIFWYEVSIPGQPLVSSRCLQFIISLKI